MNSSSVSTPSYTFSILSFRLDYNIINNNKISVFEIIIYGYFNSINGKEILFNISQHESPIIRQNTNLNKKMYWI